MGRQDVCESDYLEDNRRFADLINGALYCGTQIVLPQDLEEADPELFLIGEKEHKKMIRDKVRKWKKNGIVFAILTVENQNYVDYAMVLRSMLMEAMAYHKQWKKKKKQHGEVKDLKGKDEFLSEMQKEEKYVPIIPLIVYYGTDKSWDGPRTLFELLDLQDKEELKPFINDYKLNMFDFHEKESFQEFWTELQTLFEFLRYSGDEETLHEIVHKNPDRYRHLDNETAKLISELTGIEAEEIFEETENIKNDTDEKIDGERRETDMCKAWDDHKLKGIIEGKIEGKTEKTQIVVCNMLKRGMSDEDICDLAECTPEFVEEVRRIEFVTE